MDRAVVALIEEHVRHILTMMGFSDVTVHCQPMADVGIRVDVNAGREGRLLIGSKGTHLLAFQYILRCLLRKSLEKDMRVVVDVNGYRTRREATLLDLAQEVARRAQRTGRTVVLRPMSAADRRAIHTALASHKDIATESLGDEPNRRVVVRPVFL
jgi:spoIIIJ-associated protein